MNEIQKVKNILSILNKIYPTIKVPLKSRNVFTLLISVLLSAQCTDERVNKITPALFKMADTPEKMAATSIEAIQAIIRPCGLSPQKAKAIYKLSHLLIERHDCEVPADFAALENLPE